MEGLVIGSTLKRWEGLVIGAVLIRWEGLVTDEVAGQVTGAALIGERGWLLVQH